MKIWLEFQKNHRHANLQNKSFLLFDILHAPNDCLDISMTFKNLKLVVTNSNWKSALTRKKLVFPGTKKFRILFYKVGHKLVTCWTWTLEWTVESHGKAWRKIEYLASKLTKSTAKIKPFKLFSVDLHYFTIYEFLKSFQHLFCHVVCPKTRLKTQHLKFQVK